MTYEIGILLGDDIGPEVVPEAVNAARAALAAVGVATHWRDLPIGLTAYRASGTTLPEATMTALDRLDGWILGPIGHRAYPKNSGGAFNPHPIIRKAFDMYASYRPAKSYATVPSLHRDIDLVIVRENTEGFPPDRNVVAGSGEFRPTDDVTISVRVITRRNSERIARAAFELAATRPARRVTAVHKDTVFKLGCGMFAEECRKVASEYPAIAFDEVMVDTFALKLAMRPQQFDVVVTTNTFGDILVDLAAGLVGGMGMAPAISAGPRHVMAQASHGSAPDIAGKGIANPYAEIMSMQMMLKHLGLKRSDPRMTQAAELIENAVTAVIADGRALTPDIGGDASTAAMGAAIVDRIRRWASAPRQKTADITVSAATSVPGGAKRA
jgi:3-isopropylmalate dehydrogenase